MESVESMIAIVQVYINIHKNIQVNVKIVNFVEIRKLKEAYNIAYNWLKEYELKLERNI